MNQPDREEFEELKRTVKKLEQDHSDIAENEKMLLKLAKYHRAGLQELNGKIERLELAQGDTNERLDKIERTQEGHNKRFDHIDQTLVAHTEVLNKIVSLLEGQ
jgi:predicted nuclease with TOPRIM domain